jgi:hypothetical protein
MTSNPSKTGILMSVTTAEIGMSPLERIRAASTAEFTARTARPGIAEQAISKAMAPVCASSTMRIVGLGTPD